MSHQHDHRDSDDHQSPSRVCGHAHGHAHKYDHEHGHTHERTHPSDHANHHTHDSHHHHLPDSNRIFAIGAALNLGFVLVELGFGWWTNSLALLADAGHNFSDVIGLLLAWGAVRLAARAPSKKFTYGLGSTTILAALANAILLLLATGAIVWEAVHRLLSPVPVAGGVMVAVALVGVVVNSITALLFARGRERDLNMRGVYLHMVADAAVSLAVVVAGLLVLAGGWVWLDPAISVVIAAVIVWGTWGLLRESLQMALQAVPASIDPEAVENFLRARPGVADVHDLHIWAISTRVNALTVHLVMPQGHPGDPFFADLADALEHQFGIQHPTVQIEIDDASGQTLGQATSCRFAPRNVV